MVNRGKIIVVSSSYVLSTYSSYVDLSEKERIKNVGLLQVALQLHYDVMKSEQWLVFNILI